MQKLSILFKLVFDSGLVNISELNDSTIYTK